MFCDKCGQEADDNSVYAPDGAGDFKAGRQNKASADCLIAFLIPVIILAMCALIENNAGGTPAKTKHKSGLEVLDTYRCQLSPYGGDAVCGTVVNNTNRTMSYAQVEINLYDTDNNQIGSALANINNLASGSKWKFKAPVYAAGRYRWTVANVTGR